MLSGISITCFTTSYLVALVLEVLRLFSRKKVPLWAAIVFGLLGLFTQSVYIWMLATEPTTGAPLGDWYSWILMASWIVAAAYVGLAVRRSQSNVGIFFLPLILLMIGVAIGLRDAAPFSPDNTLSMWRMVHGVSLLLGTVAMTMGFAAGVMYLIQSTRLKKKLPPPSRGIRLPNLEWLQGLNRETLWLSTLLVGVGLVSGVALNIDHDGDTNRIAWTDPTILSSGGLFLWLAAAAVFELCYKPARVGRKVAYLTMVSFVFLAFVLASVFWGQHASEPAESSTASSDAKVEAGSQVRLASRPLIAEGRRR